MENKLSYQEFQESLMEAVSLELNSADMDRVKKCGKEDRAR